MARREITNMHNRWKYFKQMLSFLLVSINLTPAVGGYCYTSNFTSNSTYGINLSLILSSLASHVTLNNGRFYNTSIGQDPNKVYALALCRGDSPSNEYCVDCVKTASQDIMRVCPNKKEAFIWGGGVPECLVRYADHSIYGELDLPPYVTGYGGNLTEIVKSNLTGFDETWETLMDSLVKKVSIKFSMLKFATEEANFNTFQKIYALMQCTPDMSQRDCDFCLRQSVAQLEACCLRNVGGNVGRATCYFGWSLNPFYSPHIDPPPPDQTTNTTVNMYQGMCNPN